MGIKEMMDGLTGKSASDKKAQDAKIAELMAQIAALQKQNAELTSENQQLKTENTTLQEKYDLDIKKTQEESMKKGIQEGRHQMTQEAWAEKNSFKDLDKQTQMSKLMNHIAADEILPQEQDKILKTLSDLMQSESVDVMQGKDVGSRESLMETFCQDCRRRISSDHVGSDMDFLRKTFKIILNTKGKNGPKVNLTSSLPDRSNPLLGYFVTNELLPFFETAVSSNACNFEKLNESVLVNDIGDRETLNGIQKTLLQHGYDPNKDASLPLREKERLLGMQQQLKTEGKIKPKLDISKRIQEINTMSVKQMRDKLVRDVKQG